MTPVPPQVSAAPGPDQSFFQRHRRGLTLLVGPCLTLLPVVVLFNNHGLGVLTPAALVAEAVAIAVGLLLGTLMLSERLWLKVPALAAGLLFVVDVQTDWMVLIDARLLAVVAGALLCAWLFRHLVHTVVVAVAGAMLLSTLVVPTGSLLRVTRGEGSERAPDPRLPPVVHLILDEHAGIESIDRAFDPQAELVDRARQLYVDRGFTVFGRAYSRWFYTFESVSHLFNFSRTQDVRHWYGGTFAEGKPMRRNAGLELLKERGYKIFVTQPTAVELCTTSGGALADVCQRYESESVANAANPDLPLRLRIAFVGDVLQRRSYMITKSMMLYMKLRSGLERVGVGLPAPDPDTIRLGALTTRRVIDDLREQLRHLQPGEAHVAHLLLPHFPYTFRRDCTPIPGGHWLIAFAKGGGGASAVMNDAQSRAPRYAAYLDQLACVLQLTEGLLDAVKASGHWRDALIIVHGDHGSRLALRFPYTTVRDQITARDYLDGFGALFAAKLPGQAEGQGRYDRRMLPIQQLYPAALRDQRFPEGTAWVGNRRVALQPGHPTHPEPGQAMVVGEADMPPFAHGLPLPATDAEAAR